MILLQNAIEKLTIEIFGDREINTNLRTFILTKSEERKINNAIKCYRFPFKDAYEFLNYVKSSIQAREFAKFNFTKVIDLIFKKVKKFQEIAFLELTIFHT